LRIVIDHHIHAELMKAHALQICKQAIMKYKTDPTFWKIGNK
jgi:hypothetical protein